jgi:hypothetical protein
MTKRPYNIEVLLQYWNVKAGVPQNYPMTRVPPQQQKRHDSEAQRSPNERRTRKLFTVVTTQTLPFSVEIVEQECTQQSRQFRIWRLQSERETEECSADFARVSLKTRATGRSSAACRKTALQWRTKAERRY